MIDQLQEAPVGCSITYLSLTLFHFPMGQDSRDLGQQVVDQLSSSTAKNFWNAVPLSTSSTQFPDGSTILPMLTQARRIRWKLIEHENDPNVSFQCLCANYH